MNGAIELVDDAGQVLAVLFGMGENANDDNPAWRIRGSAIGIVSGLATAVRAPGGLAGPLRKPLKIEQGVSL